MYARKLSALKSGAAGLWGVHVSENRRRARILKIRQSMESDLDEIMEIYASAASLWGPIDLGCHSPP